MLFKVIKSCIFIFLFASHFALCIEVVRYQHTDILGSVIFESDNSGAILPSNSFYMPYGERVGGQKQGLGFTGALEDTNLGLTYMQQRYYDPTIGRFYSNDPIGFNMSNPISFNRYAYANNNPYRFIDPDGSSPISLLAKHVAKSNIKDGISKMADFQLRRFSRYMDDDMAKSFRKDLGDVASSMDSEPYEMVLEIIPIVGDIYGGAKFSKQVTNAYNRMQDLENAYIQKILDKLPVSQRADFLKAIRNMGVRDAKKDLDLPRTGCGYDMHHICEVHSAPDKASDPRNIEPMTREDHIEHHKKKK